MSRLRADRIVNRAANGPVELTEGFIIPSNKRIAVGSLTGSPGQVLTSTVTGLTWATIPKSVSRLNDLDDVNINSPGIGEVVRFNGQQYVNSRISYNDLTNRPSIPEIPDNVILENSSPTFNTVSVTGNLIVTGTTTTTNLTTLNVTNNKIVLNDSTTTSPVANASVEIERGVLPNTQLRWNETVDRWEFTNDGSVYYNLPLPSEYGDYTKLNNIPTVPQILNDLVDVSVASALPDQILRWNGLTWTASNEKSGAGSFTLPIASPGTLGGVKVDGTSITINSDGIIENTYTISLLDAETNVKTLRLNNNGLTNQDIEISVGTGITLTREDNILIFTGTTYALSAETADGNSVNLRLANSNLSNNDVNLLGADGILIERTDENTITFRATNSGGGGTVSSDTIKDAAALLFVNGTHSGITYTYDSNNKVINSIASAGGGSGNAVLYDFVGENTTSNNAILKLVPSSGTTDEIEIAGGDGTNVSWDSDNNKITISSTAPVNPDWNATSGLAQILNKPTIPSAYSLPTATSEALGGVKVGDNLSIDENGTLSANPGSYTLPIASDSVLGGIKIGSGLSIDGNGVVNATGGSTVPSIQDLSGTTIEIESDNTEELNIIGYKAYSLFKITTNAEAWVRVYVSDASRDDDQNRSEGQDPTPGSGVIAEVRTSGAEAILISPGIMGFNNDNPRTDTIYLSVTNRTQQSRTITVTLTALQIGE